MWQEMFEKRKNIPYAQSRVLKDEGLCGFEESPQFEPHAWMLSVHETDEFTSKLLFDNIEELEIVNITDVKVPKLPTDKNIRKGLSLGVVKVIDLMLDNDADEIKQICAFAENLIEIDNILPDDESTFDLLNDNNMSPSVEQKEKILILIEKAIDASSEHDETESLRYLKSSLEDIQAQTWDDVIRAIYELDGIESQWNYFQSITQLPKNPPVFTFKPKTDTFRRGQKQWFEGKKIIRM